MKVIISLISVALLMLSIGAGIGINHIAGQLNAIDNNLTAIENAIEAR